MSSFENVTTKKGLGRGLGSLLGGVDLIEEAPKKETQKKETTPSAVPAPSATAAPATARPIPEESRVWSVAIEKIIPNPRQPRKEFDSQKLKELSDSVKEKGILQPIVARKTEKGLEIIAGERRWRAAQQAGLKEVPVILKKVSDAESMELALIENIQRHDLNPIDEAEAYQLLATRFGLTQDQISQRVGKDRSTVTNSMRLLGLVPQVKDMVRSGALSTGHAKVLLTIVDQTKQLELAKKAINLRLSVRAIESLIKNEKSAAENKTVDNKLGMDVSKRLVGSLSEELQKILGTKVQIDYAQGKGKISVHFYSDEELTQVVDKLRKSWKN